MLRGDAPGRPNPRLKPHADSFWVHIRPSYYNRAITGVYPTFRLGWLSTYFFFFETLTGIFLMVFYIPAADEAYGSMLDILSNVPLGQFMRDLHRLGAEAMVLVVAFHMLRTFWTASYKKPRQFTWATGVLLLFFTLGLSFTGYLLPWDQLAYWAVTIGSSMAEATPPPVVGEFINILMRGAPTLGGAGLLRFYLLHILVFPILLLALLSMHYYKVVIHGASMPPELEEVGSDMGKRVPVPDRVYFLPDVMATEVWMLALTTLLMVLACIFIYDAPLENHANPLSTPLHTVAPWYFLWIQGWLKLGDKTLMGVVLPLFIILPLFVIMPYLDVGPVRHWGKRRLAISTSLLFMSMISISSWMGTPAFLVQTTFDQEILFEMAPTEKIGLVRATDYHDLQEAIEWGEISTANYQVVVPEDNELYKVMEEYQHLIAEGRELDPVTRGGLPNAIGYLEVTQLQADVVGVVLTIVWDDHNNPGESVTSELLVPVHEESYQVGGH
jgi:quinol-cytochrome oxidoreductase complex cytochrome b subunit